MSEDRPQRDGRRRLIVNADDFGLSPGVNAGIIESHERGIVTAASLMVRWPAAEMAAEYARSHPLLDVGLHIDLAEMACRNGQWETLYEVVPQRDAAAVADEVTRQVDTFHRLMGQNPSHVDSHQHVHLDEPARSIVVGIAHELGVPLRQVTPGIGYWGQFYGQSDDGKSYPQLVGVDALIHVLGSLPAAVTELGCHPAKSIDILSMYADERVLEMQTLCDDQVREAVRSFRIELCRFGDAAPAASEPAGMAHGAAIDRHRSSTR